MVEIIGGAPNGLYQGVDLYQVFLDTANTEVVTPVTFMQDGSPPIPGAGGEATPFDPSTIAGIQAALAALGFDPGVIDGKDGPNTQAAVSAFQTTQGLDPDGQAGDATVEALRTALVAAGYEVL